MAKKALTPEQLVRLYMELRDRESVLKADFDEKKKVLVTKKDKIQAALLSYLNKNNLTSLPTTSGTASIRKQKYARITDPDKLAAYIQETGDIGVYSQRLSSSHIEKLLEEDGIEVPGTTFGTERKISIRKPTKKKA